MTSNHSHLNTDDNNICQTHMASKSLDYDDSVNVNSHDEVSFVSYNLINDKSEETEFTSSSFEVGLSSMRLIDEEDSSDTPALQTDCSCSDDDDDFRNNVNSSVKKGKPSYYQASDSCDTNDSSLEEPFGCKTYMKDVTVEFNLGGNKPYTPNNKHTFKLKRLPYLVQLNKTSIERLKVMNKSSSVDLSTIKTTELQSSRSNSSDKDSLLERSMSSPDSMTTICNQNQLDGIIEMDVTKMKSAFLANSQFVPCNKIYKLKRTVQLEIISAKLSDNNNNNTPSKFNYNSNNDDVSRNSRNHSSDNLTGEAINSSSSSIQPRVAFHHDTPPSKKNNFNLSTPSKGSSPSLTSRRYVNYTLLMKNVPGLDTHPALIERRFSHFASLYYSLKNDSELSKHLEENSQFNSFPKKILIGNFSLENIAERCVEFARLLNVCMSNKDILRSSPFISFLLDKELIEAHNFLLQDDVDNAQGSLETAYQIIKKLFLNNLSMLKLKEDSVEVSSASSSTSSSNTVNDMHRSSTSSQILVDDTTNTIEQKDKPESTNNESHTQNSTSVSNATSVSKKTTTYTSDIERNGIKLNDSYRRDVDDQKRLNSLCQRLLITYCLIFTTYHLQGFGDKEFKTHVLEFCELISSEKFILSIIRTKHYLALRASLLFLLNINNDLVISIDQQLAIKRCLEEVDVAHMEMNESVIGRSMSKLQRLSHSPQNGTSRLTKRDLASLVNDRNFCTFQENKW